MKYGALATFQSRDFQIARFQVSCWDDPSVWSVINGDPNLIFDDSVLVTASNPIGSYMNPRATITDRSSQFESSKRNFSGYISNELKLFGVLKTVVGLRMEKFDLFYTGQNSSGDNYNNENVIDKLDLFPTGNFIYQISENSNLRTSFSRTTARPSFKEASIAQIFDPLSNMTFVGNIDLKPTYIQNYDVRYEFFGEFSQMMAVSFFYKIFQDPIEMTYYESAPTNFTPNNFGSANVGGIEFEIRKNLKFVSERLKDLSFNINMSIIESRLTFSESEKARRESSKRTGETVGDYRTLQGQAPYLINSGINYSNPKTGIQTGLFYNVQGKTLEIVGDGFRPDVFRIPFHSLNFNFNKTFGKERKSTINIRANNLLGDVKESMVESYGTESLNFRLRNPGRIFSLGFKYRF